MIKKSNNNNDNPDGGRLNRWGRWVEEAAMAERVKASRLEDDAPKREGVRIARDATKSISTRSHSRKRSNIVITLRKLTIKR